MSSATLSIAYKGPALEDGTIDIDHLAPALVAFADLVKVANSELNGDRAEVSIKVQAGFRRGSFEFDLSVIQDIVQHTPTFLSTSEIYDAAKLVGILFGSSGESKHILESVLEFFKWLAGKQAQKRILDDGRAEYMRDNNPITINGNIEHLVINNYIRSDVSQIAEPLEQDGIDQVVFQSDVTPVLDVDTTRGEVLTPPELESDAPAEPSETQVVTEQWVELVTVAFDDKYQWRLKDDHVFTATMEDSAFRARINEGEAFRLGDLLFVELLTTQTLVDEDLQTSRSITRVIEHRPQPEMRRFEGME